MELLLTNLSTEQLFVLAYELMQLTLYSDIWDTFLIGKNTLTEWLHEEVAIIQYGDEIRRQNSCFINDRFAWDFLSVSNESIITFSRLAKNLFLLLQDFKMQICNRSRESLTHSPLPYFEVGQRGFFISRDYRGVQPTQGHAEHQSIVFCNPRIWDSSFCDLRIQKKLFLEHKNWNKELQYFKI